MARSVSATFKAAAFGQETSEAFLLLVEIDHADLAAPIRVSSDGVDTISNGNTFVAYPFQISLPDDTDNGTPMASLTIDNVDRSIVEAVRSIDSPATVTIQLVLASDPDTVEAEFPYFEMTNVDYDKLTVTGQLAIERFDNDPFPAKIYNPEEFPGMPW